MQPASGIGVPRPGLLTFTATGRSDGSSFSKKLNLGVDQKGHSKHIRTNWHWDSLVWTQTLRLVWVSSTILPKQENMWSKKRPQLHWRQLIFKPDFSPTVSEIYSTALQNWDLGKYLHVYYIGKNFNMKLFQSVMLFRLIILINTIK